MLREVSASAVAFLALAHCTGVVFVCNDADEGTQTNIIAPLWEVPSGPSALFSPDGKLIATCGRALADSPGNSVLILDARSGAIVREVTHHNLDVFNFGFSSNGALVFTSSQRDGSVVTWEASTGRQVAQLTALSPTSPAVVGYATKSVLSPNGRYVAVVQNGADKWFAREWATISIWDVERRKKLRELPEKEDSVELMRFSPSGDELFVRLRRGGAKLWDVTAGKVRTRFGEHLRDTLGVAFSSTGKYIAGHARGDGVSVYDSITAAEVATFEEVPGPVAFAFGRDDRLLATGGWGVIQVRDLKSGAILATFGSENALQRVTHISFSPDGKLLAAHLANRGTVVWAVPQSGCAEPVS